MLDTELNSVHNELFGGLWGFTKDFYERHLQKKLSNKKSPILKGFFTTVKTNNLRPATIIYMYMSILFAIMIVASLVMLIFTNPNAILGTSLGAAATGIQLAIQLAAIYIFWMGIIQIAIDSGLIGKLARLMRPIIRWLFGEQKDEVNELLATNISANMIGAGNAATPAAIEAIEKMAEPDQKKASTPMIMLFVLSATSMQILPTTVIGILEKHGAENSAFVIWPTIIVSTITTLLGVLLIKLFARKKKVKLIAEDIEVDGEQETENIGGES